MCGIVYVHRKDKQPAARSVWKRYNRQKQRGSEGFGYVAMEKNKIVAIERACTEKEIYEKLKKETATCILFHHRLPTSVPNIVEGTHPIVIEHGELKHTYYVMHNGVIRNDDELKPIHEKAGYKYKTSAEKVWRTATTNYSMGEYWNDSEALAFELAMYIEGKSETVATEGAVAIILIQAQNKNVKGIYYGRNIGNPLTITSNETVLAICSQGERADVPSGDMWKLNDYEPVRLELSVPNEYTYATPHYAIPYTPHMGYTKQIGFQDMKLHDYADDENELYIEIDSLREMIENGKAEMDGALTRGEYEWYRELYDENEEWKLQLQNMEAELLALQTCV